MKSANTEPRYRRRYVWEGPTVLGKSNLKWVERRSKCSFRRWLRHKLKGWS